MISVKEILKRSKFLRQLYYRIHSKGISLLIKISPVLASKYLYKKTLGKKLNLKNPKDFNEKVQWLKLYWQHPLVIQCADKYEIRSFVRERGCGKILNELYGVYRDISEIKWEKLPRKFALKTTNASGTNIICDDKDNLDKDESLERLDGWMKKDYSLIAAEMQYSKMVPKIICEKYIETDSGLLPNDYKIFCFNGEPKVILVITERDTGNHQRFFFDINWNQLDIVKVNNTTLDIPLKPKSLEEMLDYSTKLSKGFPFVRMDFYDYNDKPILGEMTFTPVGGMATYYKDEALKMFGDWIELPPKYNS